MVQRHVLYLGEINDTQELAWRRSIEVLEGQRADQNSRYTPSVLKAVEAISPRSQVPLPAVMAARIMTAAVLRRPVSPAIGSDHRRRARAGRFGKRLEPQNG